MPGTGCRSENKADKNPYLLEVYIQIEGGRQ